MSNDVMSSQAWNGHIVPRNFTAGYVVLSYLVSYVGAWTTLELINRRTAGRGLYNRYLLFGSSISMGGIAIWCMHYIGNRAIVLGDGQPAMQIAYSSGYTTVSFFVPILVLLAAFTSLGFDDKVSIARITIGGTLAGLAICGMHYLGQAGISNYTSVYSIGNVVGSAVIAVVASIVALFVFFVLRATWTNSWWKRALCANILAGAVFGMHWTASVGTQYRLYKTDSSFDYDISRNSTVIVVIVLSIAACFILIALATLAQRRRSRSANRAQQVVLAAAIFDKNKRIMVTPEGLLPSQAVTSSYVKRVCKLRDPLPQTCTNQENSLLMEYLKISHPVFHWIFRATHNWSAISRLLPGMRNHLYNFSALKGLRPGLKSETRLSNVGGELAEDFSIIFREQFCIAAADLAKEMNEPLEITGQKAPLNPDTRRNTPQSCVDLESDGTVSSMLGRGQLLFLVRRVNEREAECLSASGYRFAEIKNVVHLIERRMQINCNDLQGRLSSMIRYSDKTHVLKPGVHLACFAIRVSVGGDFDVLVRKDARNQLPTMQLPIDDLNDWKTGYLSRLDGWSVTACLEFLIAKSGNSSIMKKEQTFATQLYNALERLKEEINDPFFVDALFIARPVSAPCCGLGRDAKPGQATLLVFRLPVPVQLGPRSKNLEFIPLSFFRTQQYVHRNSPDHAVFARKVHREFGPILNEKRLSVGDGRKNSRGARLPRLSIMTFRSRCTVYFRSLLNDSTSAKVQKVHTKAPGLPFRDLESDGEPRTSPRVSLGCGSEMKLVDTQMFGGVLVSQEINVDIRDSKNSTAREAMDGLWGIGMVEMQHAQIGTSSGAAKEAEDVETFVDKLLTIYIS